MDSLIIVSNNNLLQVIGRKPLQIAFAEADNVLRQGVQTITDLIAVPALINLDFADIQSVMKNKGSALIGIGMAEGENKAIVAAEKAIQSPLLEAQITGAKHAIINITGGSEITLFDAQDATQVIRDMAGNDIDTIFGVAINDDLGDAVIVTVIATGFDHKVEGDRFSGKIEFETNIHPKTEENSKSEKIPTFFDRRKA